MTLPSIGDAGSAQISGTLTTNAADERLTGGRRERSAVRVDYSIATHTREAAEDPAVS